MFRGRGCRDLGSCVGFGVEGSGIRVYGGVAFSGLKFNVSYSFRMYAQASRETIGCRTHSPQRWFDHLKRALGLQHISGSHDRGPVLYYRIHGPHEPG